MKVDLNADMGESFGAWLMGNDAALLDIVTSANVACGFHAGGPDVMARTMRMAVDKGVGIGAHPGFADLEGFGRRRMELSHTSLANLVRYQLGAAEAMAKTAGGAVRHMKLHGALSNMTCEDAGLARVAYEAALDLRPDLVIVALAGTVQQAVCEDLRCAWAGEIFADRAYEDDATLVDRRKAGAMLHDPAVAGPRIAAMVLDGAIHAASGKRIPARIDTVCVHGDGPEALAIARAVRAALEAAGVEVARL